MLVETRKLQLINNPNFGDSVDLLLLHWDRKKLRISYAFGGFGAMAPEHREGGRVAARCHLRRAQERAKQDLSEENSLREVFPVLEGFGAALYWSPVLGYEAKDGELDFLFRSGELGFQVA